MAYIQAILHKKELKNKLTDLIIDESDQSGQIVLQDGFELVKMVDYKYH